MAAKASPTRPAPTMVKGWVVGGCVGVFVAFPASRPRIPPVHTDQLSPNSHRAVLDRRRGRRGHRRGLHSAHGACSRAAQRGAGGGGRACASRRRRGQAGTQQRGAHESASVDRVVGEKWWEEIGKKWFEVVPWSQSKTHLRRLFSSSCPAACPPPRATSHATHPQNIHTPSSHGCISRTV